MKSTIALILLLLLSSTVVAAEQTFEGELAEGDKTYKAQDGLIDYYPINLEVGQLLTLTMTATAGDGFDTFLVLTGPSGQEYVNDDAEGAEGSQLIIRVPETGVWEIGATGYDAEEIGPYKVTAQTQGLKLVLGERGELDAAEDDVLLKQGELYDKFAVNVETGKTYVVMAASSEFDTFLSIHYPGGLVTNDDSLSSYETSMASFTPKQNGQATIIITSYYAEEEGRYRLAAYETVPEKPEP